VTANERDPTRECDGALGREDAKLVAALRETFRAPERTAARNAAFDARLAARLREGGGGFSWWGGVAAAAASVALALVTLSGVEPRPAPEAALEAALAAVSYADEYAESDAGSAGSAEGDFDDSLPKDYVAIESLFLGS